MERGEVWLVGLDPSEGREQKGRRPVLIVLPEAFNRVTKVPVVLPVTSGGSFARMPEGVRRGPCPAPRSNRLPTRTKV